VLTYKPPGAFYLDPESMSVKNRTIGGLVIPEPLAWGLFQTANLIDFLEDTTKTLFTQQYDSTLYKKGVRPAPGTRVYTDSILDYPAAVVVNIAALTQYTLLPEVFASGTLKAWEKGLYWGLDALFFVPLLRSGVSVITRTLKPTKTAINSLLKMEVTASNEMARTLSTTISKSAATSFQNVTLAQARYIRALEKLDIAKAKGIPKAVTTKVSAKIAILEDELQLARWSKEWKKVEGIKAEITNLTKQAGKLTIGAADEVTAAANRLRDVSETYLEMLQGECRL